MTSGAADDQLLLRVAYDGRLFSGFQRQRSCESVQEFVEKKLQKALGWNSHIQFASRTDAGVHALDQCIILPASKSWFLKKHSKKLSRLRLYLNSHFERKVVVWQAAWLSANFSFKKDVLWKTYRYLIYNSRVPLVMDSDLYLWIKKPLDWEAMKREANHFLGEHDFAAFAKSSGREAASKASGTTRKILSMRMKRSPHPSWSDSQFIEIDVRGKGFLHHMVRNMVGSLVDIGMGKPLDVLELLRGRIRDRAGRAAPASALTLLRTKVRDSRLKVFDPSPQSPRL